MKNFSRVFFFLVAIQPAAALAHSQALPHVHDGAGNAFSAMPLLLSAAAALALGASLGRSWLRQPK